MASLADSVFQGSLAIVQGNIILLGIGLLIIFAIVFFALRLNLAISIVLFVVLLDGFVGFNYTDQGAGFNGAFNDPLFVGFLTAAYFAVLVVVALGAIKAFNK